MSSEGLWDEGRRAWERLHARQGADASDPRAGSRAVEALADVALLRHLLAQAELAAVRTARRQGRPWAEIATSLGITRQSAWERWRDLDTDDVTATASNPAEVLDTVAAELVTRHDDVTVPGVVGMTWPRAQELLRGVGLLAEPAGDLDLVVADHPDDWTVHDQKPEGGERVELGTTVFLWLRRGPGEAGVREPRRPLPDPPAGVKARDETTDEPVG